MEILLAISLFLLLCGVISWLLFSPVSSRMPWRIKTTKKLVALTFDDGPNQPFTLQIADAIERANGRATFFVVGKNCERFPGTAAELYRRGHQIGLHSYGHKFSSYFTDPTYRQEIARTRQILADEGISTNLFRFPWLFRTPWLLKSVESLGFRTPISGLFSHPFEPFQVNAKKIINNTLRQIKPGVIIIFHDGYNAQVADRTQTLAAVKEVVRVLKSEGYEFVTVDELLACENR